METDPKLIAEAAEERLTTTWEYDISPSVLSKIIQCLLEREAELIAALAAGFQVRRSLDRLQKARL